MTAIDGELPAIAKRMGIEMCIRDSRHTFATKCIELGVDIKSLSEILGHSSVTITLNRYVHSSMDLKQQQINKLEQLASL